MAWFRFTRDFTWHPHPSVAIEYRAGRIEPVTRRCAAAALARGCGQFEPRPEKFRTTKAGKKVRA